MEMECYADCVESAASAPSQIQCDICLTWVHKKCAAKHDSNYSDAYRSGQIVHFFRCRECFLQAKQTEALSSTILVLKHTIGNLTAEISDTKTKMESISTELRDTKLEVRKLLKSFKNEKEALRLLMEKKQEEMEELRRWQRFSADSSHQ